MDLLGGFEMQVVFFFSFLTVGHIYTSTDNYVCIIANQTWKCLPGGVDQSFSSANKPFHSAVTFRVNQREIHPSFVAQHQLF